MNSAFNTSTSLPGVVDASLTQETPQDFDPNYNTYQSAIDAEKQLELPEYEESKVSSKSQSLDEKTKQKNEQINGKPKAQGSDSLVDLLQSSFITTGADLADSVLELGSNIAGKIADVTDTREYFTEEEQATSATFFDKYTEQEFGDKVAGYDRTDYAQSMKNVEKFVSEGEYLDAFIEGATKAPELIAESIPYIATLGIGGRLKIVNAAGKKAAQSVAKLGGSKAAQAAARASEIVRAEKNLSLVPSVVNLGLKNAGLLTMSATQTKNQNEEFAKNNDGEGMSAAQMARATSLNVLMNGLDRGIFSSVVGLGQAKKGVKQIWGQIDEASKLVVAKKVAGLAVDMTKEGSQEFLQEWSQIVNENWGTKDNKNLMSVLDSSENQEQGIVAAILGSSSGGLMSAPKTVTSTLNELGKGKALKKDMKNAEAFSESGYATKEDKAKHEEVAGKQYKDKKSQFDAMQKAEDDISNISSSDKSDLDKVTEAQQAIHEAGKQRSDTTASAIVSNIGTQEVQDIVKELSSNEDIQKLPNLVEALKKAMTRVGSETTSIKQFQMLEKVVNQMKDNAPQKLKDLVAESKVKIEEQASSAIKKDALNITYQESMKQVNKEGLITGASLDAAINKKAPKTELDTSYEELAKLDKKELQAKLSEYDNKTIAKIMTEVAKVRKQERKDKNTTLRSPLTSVGKKAKTTLAGVLSTDADKIKKAIKRTKDIRKQAKNVYDPKKSMKENVVSNVKNVWNKLKEATKREDGKPHEEFKATANTTIQAVGKLDKDSDVTLLQEAVTELERVGNITKQRADILNKKLNDFIDKTKEKTKDKDFSVDNMRTQIKKTFKDTLSKIKNAKREDVKKIYEDFTTKLGSKLNAKEKKVIINTLVDLLIAGQVSIDFVNEQVDKIRPDEKLTKEDIKNFYKDTLDKAKEAQKSGTEKVKETVDKAKDSNLAQEVAKDAEKVSEASQKLFDTMLDKVSNIEISEAFNNLTKKVTEADYLEIYQSMKDIATLNKNDKDIDVVTEVVDSNGNPILKENKKVC